MWQGTAVSVSTGVGYFSTFTLIVNMNMLMWFGKNVKESVKWQKEEKREKKEAKKVSLINLTGKKT